MQDLAVNLGIDVLFKGTNFIRLLGGLWTALWISLVSVAISIPLGKEEQDIESRSSCVS